MKSKYRLSALIVVIVAVILALLHFMKPAAKQRPAPPIPAINVQAVTLTAAPFTYQLASFGVVKPRTQSILQSQVSGEVVWLNSQFRDGGFFRAGEVLVKLDDRDYQARVKTAKANVLSAEQALIEEKARGEQALQDWQRLGNGAKTPSPLVLREPQMAAAQAKLLSAQAELATAELALARTQVAAPFDGRVLSKKVDLGQLASNNSQLAEIYATDYVEIRLPLKQRDLPFIALPEQFREGSELQAKPAVTITSTLFGEAQSWQGKIVRTESAIDSNAQQLYVVAQIDDPFSTQHQDKAPLKIGQYVTASIEGKTFAEQLLIPNKALYQNSYVFVVEAGRLARRDLTISWQNDRQSVVSNGLKAGDVLVTSPLGQVVSGTVVSIVELDGKAQQTERKGKRRDAAAEGQTADERPAKRNQAAAPQQKNAEAKTAQEQQP
ncbi:efflux RND transporter periplasmic adaptor subunit [Pseudoalteromonas fenneropenaei]|uniref:Efflux RND transporter periplasmic adaptor subunit n=1 Tax=Pseudoalteromonas fenneropenaei TaxID=1737459 RepID=A0ABV7CH67_9GAMM